MTSDKELLARALEQNEHLERGVNRLVAQNERLQAQIDTLIGALVANQPVEVIKAMNPPAVAPPREYDDPWAKDAAREAEAETVVVDPWADPDVTNEQLITQHGIGWVSPTPTLDKLREVAREQEAVDE